MPPGCNIEADIADAIRQAVAERTEEAAKIVDGWHIRRGGYSILADEIRALEKQ